MLPLPYNDLLTSTGSMGRLPQRQPYFTAVFPQSPRMDKPNTSPSFFVSFVATAVSPAHLEARASLCVTVKGGGDVRVQMKKYFLNSLQHM